MCSDEFIPLDVVSSYLYIWQTLLQSSVPLTVHVLSPMLGHVNYKFPEPDAASEEARWIKIQTRLNNKY